MTGGELDKLIEDLADDLGIWWHHEHDARRKTKVGHPGWVDLILLGQHGALFPETKGTGEDRNTDQKNVALLMLAAGLPYRLWLPSDWYSGQIRDEMESIA